MIKKLTMLIVVAMFVVTIASAQSNEFDDDFSRLLGKNVEKSSRDTTALDEFRQSYEKFRQNAIKEYRDFRDQCNNEYAEFMRKAWREFRILPKVDLPVEPCPVPPVIKPKDDDKGKKNKSNPVPIKEIVKPVPPEPQPQPVAPIVEPAPAPQPLPVVQDKWLDFKFFGTRAKVRYKESFKLSLPALSGETLSQAWLKCSNGDLDGTLKDCLDLRSRHKLCDWAYLLMLRDLGDAMLGKNSNEARFITAWLYCQSGYKMRLAVEGNSLQVLFGTKHTIYMRSYYTISDTRFFQLYNNNSQGKALVCDLPFEGEKAMSLLVSQNQEFDMNMSAKRSIAPAYGSSITAQVSVNKNLIDFYDKYPASEVGGNFMTRWAMIANTPLNNQVKNDIYPILKNYVSGKSEKQQVEIILHFLHSFPYGYDNEIWGQDRAFFAEETLYYPKSDCEDHAILFSRLVRDLLGLKVVLVYYPGHLAAAVHFNGDVSGDYIMLNSVKYVVCDPTYFGAPVGETMPGMDNSSSSVILLE